MKRVPMTLRGAEALRVELKRLKSQDRPEVIEPGKLPNTGKVIFGAVVQLEDQDSGERVTYQVVGEDEADIRAGRISVSSPIARALVGKSAGEVVDVAA